jgi:hypothetical protein
MGFQEQIFRVDDASQCVQDVECTDTVTYETCLVMPVEAELLAKNVVATDT